MKAELFLLAALVSSAALGAPAAAQSLEDSLEEAASKGETLARDAAADPPGAAANASNASWQGRQANWTQAWACQASYAADERAGEAAGQALSCRAPASERAGEEEADEQAAAEEQDPARAEEAEADAEQAARDEVAAAEAFASDVREEPDETPGHLATFLNRTLSVVNRTIEIVERVLTLPLVGLGHAAEGAQRVWAGVASLAAEIPRQAAGTGEALLEGLEAARQGVASASRTSLETLETGWQGLTEAFGDDAARARDSPAPGDPSVDEAVDAGAVGDAVPVEVG